MVTDWWKSRHEAASPDYASMDALRSATHKGMAEVQFPGRSDFHDMVHEANDRYNDSFDSER